MPELAGARRGITRWANLVAREKGVVELAASLRSVGFIIVEELADLHRRHNEKLAEELGSDDLAERIFADDYRRAQKVTRSTASRAGNTFETISARIVELDGAEPPANVLVSPRAEAAILTDQLARQRYLNRRLKPLVVSDINRTAAERAAKELMRELERDPEFPRIGTAEFQVLLTDRMHEVAAEPRGELWGSTVDLAMHRDGIELMELKSGGEPCDKQFRGDVENMLMAALAYNHPDVQMRFGFYKDVNGKTASTLPPWFAHDAAARPVLIGRAYWEHILPDGVSYELWLDMVELAGQHFSITTTPR